MPGNSDLQKCAADAWYGLRTGKGVMWTCSLGFTQCTSVNGIIPTWYTANQ